MLIEIARRSETPRRSHLLPGLCDVRIDVVESVARVLRPAPSLERAALDVSDPAVLRANVFYDVFVIIWLLVYKELRELAARCYTGHKIFELKFVREQRSQHSLSMCGDLIGEGDFL